jgi:hypothetical protein
MAEAESTLTVALGETVCEGGFRRVSARPAPLALARLRELVLEIGASGSDALRAGLEGFRSWDSLAALCGTEWTAGVRRGSAAARRVLERRLRALGAAPISLARAAALPIGSAVHVRGTIRSLVVGLPDDLSRSEGGLKSHIWIHGAMTTDNVRFVAEEGHDFFLVDEEGSETACVIAARGHLVNADALCVGDRVSICGFTDRTTRGPSRAAPLDRAARALALRAGDDLPLLLRRLARDG